MSLGVPQTSRALVIKRKGGMYFTDEDIGHCNVFVNPSTAEVFYSPVEQLMSGFTGVLRRRWSCHSLVSAVTAKECGVVLMKELMDSLLLLPTDDGGCKGGHSSDAVRGSDYVFAYFDYFTYLRRVSASPLAGEDG